MEEIKKHQSEGEAWTILRGRVYNVTPYLKFHPGGQLSAVVLVCPENCGRYWIASRLAFALGS